MYYTVRSDRMWHRFIKDAAEGARHDNVTQRACHTAMSGRQA